MTVAPATLGQWAFQLSPLALAGGLAFRTFKTFATGGSNLTPWQYFAGFVRLSPVSLAVGFLLYRRFISRGHLNRQKCVFCAISDGKERAWVVTDGFEESAQAPAVVFHDRVPRREVHLLVVPRRHIAHFDDSAAFSSAAERDELLQEMLQRGRRAAVAEASRLGIVVDPADVEFGIHLAPFNLVMHLHLHVFAGRPRVRNSMAAKIGSWLFFSLMHKVT
jgi:diadenosine tetraphosphate (Ap4A) HIT family hydrolase